MNKQILVSLVFLADGSLDLPKSLESASADVTAYAERIKTDQDSVSVAITEFLLANPGLKNIATPSLLRALMNERAKKGEFDGENGFQKQEEAYKRLDEVVPAYVKGNPDQFFMGKKNGIVIHYVHGEHAKDKDGEVMFDDVSGNPVQAYRHTDEEWTKITRSRTAKEDADESPESNTVAA